MNKRSQVTIFIIIGLLIVVLVALLVIFMTDFGENIIPNNEINPNSFLTTCLEEEVKNVVSLMSNQGGYINPELKIRFQFEGETPNDIGYLCYNQNYYSPCINQEPMLINHLKEEIKEEIKENVERCFDNLVQSKNDEGYIVDANYQDFGIELTRDKISLSIEGRITLTKTEKSSKIEKFKINFETKLYDLVIVTQEILTQSARFCAFSNQGFMILYPQYKITKFETGEMTTIYTIEHKKTQERFRFAIRSCVIPPAF